jgi:putative membrane protein
MTLGCDGNRLMAQSDTHGAIVLGKQGVRSLESDEIQGKDPLVEFPATTVRFLKRLTSYPTMPDIMLNSTLCDANTDEVAAFEELIGCHGDAGGLQTQPFVLYPFHWTNVQPK